MQENVADNAKAADWKFKQSAGQFARTGYAIHGALDASLLSRVIEDGNTASDVYGSIEALIANDKSRPGFTVNVEGQLGLTCQSCGAGFTWPVDAMTTIYVARDAAELDAWEDESFESLEANEKTSALELVEDELLLAIPYVPRCEKCSADSAPKTIEFN
ncbi:MAG: YceD family protein [Casimicrobium sp.]